MKLLICTQKVDINDPILGFFHRWMEEFAKHCDSVIVICLQKGEYDLSNNVKILSLGKEEKISRLMYLFRFFKYIWKERKNYDSVFVHMNPEYAVLGGLFWRLWRKKIGLWYTHKAVNWRLRLGVFFADKIFTASEKSFRLKNKKIIITGHGIDTGLFKPRSSISSSIFTILQVARISRSKRQLELIKAFQSTLKVYPHCQLHLVGPVADNGYCQEIKDYIEKENCRSDIKLLGEVKHSFLPEIYQQVDLLVNLSETGSLDKDVLEAMACDLPVITSNQAFVSLLPPENLIFKDSEIIAKIMNFVGNENKFKGRDLIIKHHNLNNLISRIARLLS